MTVLNEIEQLLASVALDSDRVADIGTVETGDENPRVCAEHALDDFGAATLIGRGGQGQARHLRKALGQHAELEILGAEIMPPLRNAVRLVDSKQADIAALKQPQGGFAQQAFGGEIEQLEPAGDKIALDVLAGAGIERGIEYRGGHTVVRQRL